MPSPPCTNRWRNKRCLHVSTKITSLKNPSPGNSTAFSPPNKVCKLPSTRNKLAISTQTRAFEQQDEETIELHYMKVRISELAVSSIFKHYISTKAKTYSCVEFNFEHIPSKKSSRATISPYYESRRTRRGGNDRPQNPRARTAYDKTNDMARLRDNRGSRARLIGVCHASGVNEGDLLFCTSSIHCWRHISELRRNHVGSTFLPNHSRRTERNRMSLESRKWTYLSTASSISSAANLASSSSSAERPPNCFNALSKQPPSFSISWRMTFATYQDQYQGIGGVVVSPLHYATMSIGRDDDIRSDDRQHKYHGDQWNLTHQWFLQMSSCKFLNKPPYRQSACQNHGELRRYVTSARSQTALQTSDPTENERD